MEILQGKGALFIEEKDGFMFYFQLALCRGLLSLLLCVDDILKFMMLESPDVDPIIGNMSRNHMILLVAATKKPPEGGHLCLVEAAGIEPASADPPPSDLHAYFIY